VRDKVIRFSHEMLDAETQQVMATCELTGVHFERVTRKSCPFPPTVAERAKALLVR
jgi:acyl-CoA thioester hydrolase